MVCVWEWIGIWMAFTQDLYNNGLKGYIANLAWCQWFISLIRWVENTDLLYVYTGRNWKKPTVMVPNTNHKY